MTEARIELIGGEELKRLMRDSEFVRGPAQDFIRTAAFEVLAHAQQNAPVNSGRLRNSLTVDFRSRTGEVAATVGSNLVYAKPVEYGSRPHFPPVAPLELWARRKLGVPARRARSVAFAVARKIARRGTPAQPYLGPALEQSKGAIEAALARLGADIERNWSRA
jgi:phage gpG-like protein